MMKIYAKNPGGPRYFQISYKSDTSLKRPKIIDSLEPRTLDLVLGRANAKTIRQFAQILVTEKDHPIFLGYVESYEIENSKEKTLTCKGNENLLNQRYALPYYYPTGTALSVVFSDTLTTLTDPGLLLMANSELPMGLDWSYEDESLNIVKIAKGGKAYRIGSSRLFSIDYRYVREMGEATLLADVDNVDNCCYRDSEDIYIRLDDHYQRGWMDSGGVLAENAFDTYCRLGAVESKSLSGPLQTDYEPMGDLIVDTILSNGLYPHLRDTTSFTYIDIDSEEGRP